MATQDESTVAAPPQRFAGAGTEGVRALPPAGTDEDRLVTSAEIEDALGRTIEAALDFTNWDAGGGLKSLHDYQQKLATAIDEDRQFLEDVRQHVLRALRSFPNAPECAGVYQVKESDLKVARRKVLLSGNLTAVRGASVSHDSLAASLVSVGISLTRYDGQLRSWRTIFLRRDCDIRSGDRVEQIRSILDSRAKRSTIGPGAAGGDSLSRLMRRALQSAAERKALLEKTDADWRMGYGVPTPYELLTGSGSMEMIDAVLPIFESLFLANKRWVFIPDSMSSLALGTLAAALEPGQLAVFVKAKPTLEAIIERGHYESSARRQVEAFTKRAGDAIVIGGFRATQFAPAQVFFAHGDYAIHAGVVAMADAALQPHQGFPLLLELAGASAKVGLGIDAFKAMVESTYARADAANHYPANQNAFPESNE